MEKLFLITLLLTTAISAAEDCVCTEKYAVGFQTQSCPKVLPEPIENAQTVRFKFNAIELPDLMSLIAEYVGVRVCLSTSAIGVVNVTADPATPWPEVVSGIAAHHGLTSVINNEEILILGSFP